MCSKLSIFLDKIFALSNTDLIYSSPANPTKDIEDSINNLFGKIDSSFPVQVQSKPEWQKVDNPERLVRKFSFKTETLAVRKITVPLIRKKILQFSFKTETFTVPTAGKR